MPALGRNGSIRRILATRDARQFDEYSQDDLTLFGQQLRADRLELNNRLLAERAERADAYQQFDDPWVEINLAPEIGEAEALAYVFAAEVDDEEMWDQLVSAPIEPLERRYSRHDVVEEPERRHSTIGYLSPVEFEMQAGLA